MSMRIEKVSGIVDTITYDNEKKQFICTINNIINKFNNLLIKITSVSNIDFVINDLNSLGYIKENFSPRRRRYEILYITLTDCSYKTYVSYLYLPDEIIRNSIELDDVTFINYNKLFK